MVIAIVGVLVVALALVMLKVITIPIGMALAVAGIVALVAYGERRDRARHRGIKDPGRHLDSNRGVLPATAAPEPQEYAARTQADVNIATEPRRGNES